MNTGGDDDFYEYLERRSMDAKELEEEVERLNNKLIDLRLVRDRYFKTCQSRWKVIKSYEEVLEKIIAKGDATSAKIAKLALNRLKED